MSSGPKDFFSKDIADVYDEKNSNLSAITANLHFLMELILSSAPSDSKVLCVGAGTGSEILYLSRKFPNWKFMALEPSVPMLDLCKQRIKQQGIEDRCSFFNGFASDLDATEKYDIVLSILVGHFVPAAEKAHFYKAIADRLVQGGHFVNAEISCDFESKIFPSTLGYWKTMQKRFQGVSDEALEKTETQLKSFLSVESSKNIETLIEGSSILNPTIFFQSLLIHAWHGIKSERYLD